LFAISLSPFPFGRGEREGFLFFILYLPDAFLTDVDNLLVVQSAKARLYLHVHPSVPGHHLAGHAGVLA
jgi:hypothetical protein